MNTIETFEKTPILDQGYVQLIETWGADERIIEAARMSTGKGFNGWGHDCPNTDCCNGYVTLGDGQDSATTQQCPDCKGAGHIAGDEKLLAYLYNNKHSTPFEMAGMVIEVKAPIFVYREWHRHRTQCLTGSTKLVFNAPDGKPYYKPLAEIVQRWVTDPAVKRPDRQTRSLMEFNRDTISAMPLRFRKQSGKLSETNVVDAWYSGEKKVYTIHAGSNRISASKDHKFLTTDGWVTLAELSGKEVYLEGMEGNAAPDHFVTFSSKELSNEKWVECADGYDVSNLGRVRSWVKPGNPKYAVRRTEPVIKQQTVNRQGRAVVSIAGQAVQVSRLVAEAFVDGFTSECQALHADDNSLDNRAGNLYAGTAQDNMDDQRTNGGMKRHAFIPTKVSRIVACGREATFDIEVGADEHNFVANGFVTHNSYNEMSARYIPLPDENYMPSIERVMEGANSASTNKQAGRHNFDDAVTQLSVDDWLLELSNLYAHAQQVYDKGIEVGIPKELARLPVPVARYSRMRASANLRNWLQFLTLRMNPAAQWEIRMYANAVGALIEQQFPRTWELFVQSDASR